MYYFTLQLEDKTVARGWPLMGLVQEGLIMVKKRHGRFGTPWRFRFK